MKNWLRKMVRRVGYDVVSLAKLDAYLEERDALRQRRRAEQMNRLRESIAHGEGAVAAGEVVWAEQKVFFEEAARRLLPAGVLLEVGCGINPQQMVPCQWHVCCEPCEEYREHCVRHFSGDVGKVFLNADLEGVCELFPDNAVDTVYLFDVIEHVPKEVALKALEALKRIARKQVVLFTPIGFMPQHFESEEGEDQWGMGGAYWQEHRSGWEPEAFEPVEGWQVVACRDFHKQDVHGNVFEEPYGAMWAIWTKKASQ